VNSIGAKIKKSRNCPPRPSGAQGENDVIVRRQVRLGFRGLGGEGGAVTGDRGENRPDKYAGKWDRSS